MKSLDETKNFILKSFIKNDFDVSSKLKTSMYFPKRVSEGDLIDLKKEKID